MLGELFILPIVVGGFLLGVFQFSIGDLFVSSVANKRRDRSERVCCEAGGRGSPGVAGFRREKATGGFYCRPAVPFNNETAAKSESPAVYLQSEEKEIESTLSARHIYHLLYFPQTKDAEERFSCGKSNRQRRPTRPNTGFLRPPASQ